MELLLILGAVLACTVVGVIAVRLSAQSRRPPLRLDSELDERDEDLLTRVGPSRSPIDRSAEVLDIEPVRSDSRRPSEKM
ncbi:hypothetical protein [Methylobacterium gregans]|uniref:Uncharacterized protein n=1 Tax=Methylobacterium gregans TaxID=374424 RepID=A0AA37MAH4_9HYPH|nr:hypothetical protein [Methylobacterium gregans]MDQ0521467.1 uncharacterized membrane-anchored protein YhcB (DUF1043 family) [Methylobacterium gregans]GJD78136.1 hypothetical protein NBEOAGPD_1349 [Methylobacterium gregans]GLS54631.1 hypothetical protein GCM10007886_28140 [Methylobacterium gregans]